jgi:hypothetical protein
MRRHGKQNPFSLLARFGLEMQAASRAPCPCVPGLHPTPRHRCVALPSVRSGQRRRHSADGGVQSVGVRLDANVGDLDDEFCRLFSRHAAARQTLHP